MNSFDDPQDILRHALRQAIARAQSSRIVGQMQAEDAPAREPEEAARTWITLSKALLDGGQITASESVIFLTFAIETIHSKRWLDGTYPELATISARLETIERQAGLGPDQYWKRADAPQEHQRLNDAYEEALDSRFEELLRAFGLTELADLWRDDRLEYDRLREMGRRSVFEKNNHLAAVSASIPKYEDEAAKSASAGAFYAATVMLGSAVEARLLERFLSCPAETSAAYSGMARAGGPRNADPLRWNLEHMLAVAEQAGWLGSIQDDEVRANVRPWLLSVRDTRNLLHPGRHVRVKPHVIIGREEYLDAQLGYRALCIALDQSLSKAMPASETDGTMVTD